MYVNARGAKFHTPYHSHKSATAWNMLQFWLPNHQAKSFFSKDTLEGEAALSERRGVNQKLKLAPNEFRQFAHFRWFYLNVKSRK